MIWLSSILAFIAGFLVNTWFCLKCSKEKLDRYIKAIYEARKEEDQNEQSV